MNEETDSHYSWFRLCVTLLIAMIGNVGIWAIVVVLPTIQTDFGVDRAGASMAYTTTMIGFALGNLAIGSLVDRMGITFAMVLSAIGIAIGFAGASYVDSISAFAFFQFIAGFFTAVGFGPLLADISQWFVKRRGMAVAIAASGNYLSGGIWPLVLAGILEESGWRTAYMVIALTCLFAIIPLSLLLRRRVTVPFEGSAKKPGTTLQGPPPFSPRQVQILLSIAGIGCCVAMSMPQVHIVAFCVDLGFGPAVGAEMLSLMLFGGVVSRLISGALADWLGGVRTIIIGSLGQAIALFLYLPFDGLVSLYVVSLIFGLSQGGIVPSYAIVVREYLPAKEAGARVGLVMMATVFGMAFGGWLTGWIFDLTQSYRIGLMVGIGFNFLNLAVMTYLLLGRRPREPQPVMA